MLSVIDLQFLGRPRAIATGVIDTPAGVLLVDPGPATCVATLEAALADAGIKGSDLRGLLLTHIHLDHAGATGTLVARHPQLTVYVHERGAPHLIDPSKLLASAQRLYGADMDRLWGEFALVPADRVRVLVDGEKLRKYVGNVGSSRFYLCGPPVMMKKLESALLGIGVPKRRIHYERFAL